MKNMIIALQTLTREGFIPGNRENPSMDSV
jgi:hypothetical protein